MQAATHPPGFREQARIELVGTLQGVVDDSLAELLADHLLRCYPDEQWPVLRDAGRALVRRLDKVKQDGLLVRERPKRGSTGRYTTAPRRRPARPYTTIVIGLDPLHIACDCPDYLEGSLGLCKHGATVLLDLSDKPRVFARALASGRGKMKAWWDPIRPVRDGAHWLDGVRIPTSTKGSPRLGRLLEPVRASDGAPTELRRLSAAKLSGLSPARLASGVIEPLRELLRGRQTLRDPALRAWLEREQAKVERRATLAPGTKLRRKHLRSFRLQPYAYQQASIDKFLSTGRMLLADDMGLGKTVQASAIAHVLCGASKIDRVLILAPASLKSQWTREWRRATDVPIEPVEGPPAVRGALYEQTSHGALVSNYEQLFRDLPLMQSWSPELVILDEAQRIKNWATRTARAVKQLDVPYRLVLTGTPLENRLEELASIMDWVDPYALAPKWRLPSAHAITTDGKREQIGVQNLDVLRRRLEPSMLRRKRTEILTDLPARTDSVRSVELSGAQRVEHDELTPDIAKLVSQAKRRGLTQAQFLRLMSLLTSQRIIANGIAQQHFEEVWPGIEKRAPTPALLTSLGMPKLEHLGEIVESVAIDQGRKVVVFSQWRRALTLAHWSIRGLLEEHGLRAAFFTGHESQARRTQNVVDFHDDPSVGVLLCTDAGGVGLNLQRAANCCVNFDLPWNPAVLEQRVARIHRLGQPDPIDVYNLVSDDSIETRIASTIASKKAMFDGLFDGTSDQVLFDEAGGFLATVSKIVDAPNVEDSDDHDDDATLDEPPGAPSLGDDARVSSEGAARGRDPAREPRSGVVRPTKGPQPRSDEPLPGAAAVQSMFQQVQIQQREDGGIRLEAPPEAARTLSALFAGMAEMLNAAAE